MVVEVWYSRGTKDEGGGGVGLEGWRQVVKKTSSTSLKPYDLKNGNYKSAVGTWKSSNGKTIIITSDGQLELWGYTYPIDKVSPKSICVWYIYPNLC